MTTKRMNLPLPESLHARVFREAQRHGVPATQLVRRAVTVWLDERARERRAEEIREFAHTYGGTALDLDPALEAAGAEVLAQDEDDAAR